MSSAAAAAAAAASAGADAAVRAAPAAPAAALMTPTQRRVEMARTAYAAGLVILGVPKSARTDADFEAIVAIGLLLGHQSSVGGPLLLGAVLPLLLDKKRTFGWARSPGGYIRAHGRPQAADRQHGHGGARLHRRRRRARGRRAA